MVLVISLLALIPCFWLPRIQAGDLASHTYNAWLTSLVQQGSAPGLWLAPQHNNVLFDIMLLRFGLLFGFAAGERLAVGFAVLIFLWGAFALVSAIVGRPAWFLVPLLIMLTYGWTFQMGFLNFYLSLGFSSAALALIWRARSAGSYLYALPFLPPIWVANPLGLCWFVPTALYCFLARRLQPLWHLLLVALFLAGALAARFYLESHFKVAWWRGHFYELLGTDQLVLGARYHFVPILLGLTLVGCLVLHLAQTRKEDRTLRDSFPVLVQLYIVSFASLLLLPDSISFPWYKEPIALLSPRFTLALAILGCSALTSLRPRAIFAGLTACIAIVYFALNYQEASKTYALERQADALVSRLPQDARVIATIYPFRGSRIFVHHVVDRACIGHCFNLSNYEAASEAFRLRANPGNRIATASMDDANHMMIGNYVVQPGDLPLWHIFQCGPTDVDLCLRPLLPGPLQNISADEVQRARELPY